MARKRNYRLEYARRIKQGLKHGMSRSQARGHARAKETPVRNPSKVPSDQNKLEKAVKPINFQQPLYILDTFRKTDFRNWIVSSVKSSKVFYRSFDPAE